MSDIWSCFFFFFFCFVLKVLGLWNQNLTVATQVLHYLSNTPTPSSFSNFSDCVLCFCLGYCQTTILLPLLPAYLRIQENITKTMPGLFSKIEPLFHLLWLASNCDPPLCTFKEVCLCCVIMTWQYGKCMPIIPKLRRLRHQFMTNLFSTASSMPAWAP
jgi:hypothetical protein